jgi:hypothetical protein
MTPLIALVLALAPAPATTQKSVAELDREVLETVFADLLTLKGKESPVAVRGEPPQSLRFADEAAPWPITVEQVLQQHDKKLWAALSPAEMEAAREAAKGLVLRYSTHDAFAPFTSRDPRVQRVAATTQPATRTTTQPLAESYNRPIHAWSPGYTADRRFAVVQLSIPWSMHHAAGTYLLRWDEAGAKWVVVLRQFIYYV